MLASSLLLSDLLPGGLFRCVCVEGLRDSGVGGTARPEGGRFRDRIYAHSRGTWSALAPDGLSPVCLPTATLLLLHASTLDGPPSLSGCALHTVICGRSLLAQMCVWPHEN